MALLAKVLIRNSLPLTPKTSNVYNNLLRRSLRHSKGALLCAQKNERSDQDRIFTVPNLLCFGRIAVSPYLATSIINGDLKTSLAIFGFAGFTDLVSILVYVLCISTYAMQLFTKIYIAVRKFLL